MKRITLLTLLVVLVSFPSSGSAKTAPKQVTPPTAASVNQPVQYVCKKHGNIGTNVMPMQFQGQLPVLYCGICFKELLDKNVYQVTQDQKVEAGK